MIAEGRYYPLRHFLEGIASNIEIALFISLKHYNGFGTQMLIAVSRVFLLWERQYLCLDVERVSKQGSKTQKKNLHFDGEDKFLIHNLLMINYIILLCDFSLNHYFDVCI